MAGRSKSRSRKPRRVRSRKPKTMRRSKKSSFKSRALNKIPTNTKVTDMFYETTNQPTAIVIGAPILQVNRLNALVVNSTSLDTRTSSRIHIKGFRLRCHYINNLFRPLHVNVALVTPKDGQFNGSDFLTGFFTRYGLGSAGATDTGIDFGAADLNDVTMATLPINSNRLNVIWRTRFKLGVISTTGGFSSGELKNYRTLYRYVKIGKTINYPSQTSAFPDINETFYLVTWATPMSWSNSEGPIVGALDMQQHVVMAYKRL